MASSAGEGFAITRIEQSSAGPALNDAMLIQSHNGADEEAEISLITSDLTRLNTPRLPPSPMQPAEQLPSSPGPTTKRRGRPFGWRPGMGPYSNMTPGTAPVSRPKKPPGTGTGRRGRPRGKLSMSPRELFLQLKPHFNPFICEWHGCPANLQNFETLRRHILIVHGERRGSTICQWDKCAHGAMRIFASPDLFEEHVDKEHLLGLKWHCGDGPANHLMTSLKEQEGGDEELPNYLFDDNGEQVTPSVRDQEVQDYAAWQKNRKRLKELIIQRNKNAPDEFSTDEGEDAFRGAGV